MEQLTDDNLESEISEYLVRYFNQIPTPKIVRYIIAKVKESLILRDNTKTSGTSLDGILNDITLKTGFTLAELKSKGRERELVKFRYFYFKRAREKTKMSLSKISAKVNRDHASVLHGINKVDTERLQHGTLLDEYYKFWDDKPKPEVVKVICEPLPPERSEHFIDRPVKREFETSGFMAFNGYKPHQL